MHQANLIISGRVQGVFYRATCQEVAQSLGLKGWVKNLATGQVEILVQGEKDKIENLIELNRAEGRLIGALLADIENQLYEFSVIRLMAHWQSPGVRK